MMLISSRRNALFKALHRVAKGQRLPSGALPVDLYAPILLEGLHLCQEWLKHQKPPVYALFDKQALDSSTELQQLARATASSRQLFMTDTLLNALSHIGASQGVLFLVNTPQPITSLTDRVNMLWLDRVQDPGNVGTLLRTAAAAGVETIVLSAGCAGAWSPRVLRAAQGAHFVISLHEGVDLVALAESLDLPLYVAGIGPNSVSLYQQALADPCVWVVGNEGQGVGTTLLSYATTLVHVPHDSRIESLNVAVAAGICLFEQRRQQSAKAG